MSDSGASALHEYPDRYRPGVHWATDAAWEILDQLKPGLIPQDARAYIAGQIAGRLMREQASVKIGPTGGYPDGQKLNETDEGGLNLSVGLGVDGRTVIVQFGTPTAWIGLDRESAIELARALLQHAGPEFDQGRR